MPYSSTKAQFKKDLAAGKFKPEGEGFLSGVADMYMNYAFQNMMAEESEERAFARMAEKERLAENKRKLLEAEAEDKKSKDYKRKAEKLIGDIGFGQYSSNPNFMKLALETIYSAEGDYFKALERMETLAKDGRLEVIKNSIPDLQGPMLPGENVNLQAVSEITATNKFGPEVDLADPQVERFRDTAENEMATQMAAITRAGNISEEPEDTSALEDQMAGLMVKPVTEATADISEYLKGLTSINAIIGKKAALELDPDPKLSIDQRNRIKTELDKAMAEMVKQKEDEAEASREPQIYAMINKNGQIVPGRRVRGVRTKDGIRREDGTVMEGTFAWLPTEATEDFVKFNNTPIQEVVEQMGSDANLARDIIDLREIIIQNPNITNRFKVGAADVASYLQEGVDLVAALMAEDKSKVSYTEAEAISLLDQAQNLAPERKEAEMLKLRIAYGLARLEGSSGISLSDKELKAQLDVVLAKGKPERALSLLNRQLKTLVEKSETKKSTRVAGFAGEQDVKQLYENAIWNKPMDEYIREQLGEDRIQSYEEALANKTDYRTIPEDLNVKDTPLKMLENWSNNVSIQNVLPKDAFVEIIGNIDKSTVPAEEKLRLKSEAYNKMISEMGAAGLEVSITELQKQLGVK